MKSMLVIAFATVVVGYTSAQASEKGTLQQNLCKFSPLIFNNSKVTLNNLNCNKTFQAEDFITKPKIKWSDAKQSYRYTFLLVGTNTYSHVGESNLPTHYKFHFEGTAVNFHWAVSDIPAMAFEDGDITRSTYEIAEYQPLTKNPGIGSMESYRYHALIFRQLSFQRPSRPAAPARVNFNLTKFVEEQKLKSEPEAAIQAWIDPKSLENNF